MTATIEPYTSAVSRGSMIVFRDADGAVVERIAVTDVFVVGDPWPAFESMPGGQMRMVTAP